MTMLQATYSITGSDEVIKIFLSKIYTRIQIFGKKISNTYTKTSNRPLE